MPAYYVFPIFAIITGFSALLLIPKEKYKHYLLYGFLFGGVLEISLVVILTNLNLLQYKNMGPFNLFNVLSIWTPFSWMFAFSVFFYLLPKRTAFLIPYIITFAALSYSIGIVKESLGTFEYLGVNRYAAPFTFLLWYSFSAWAYFRIEKVKLKGLT